MLKRIGFEWAIRKLEAKKINKIYKISTNVLSKFITMSTASFTKVDDNKLIQIWQKKIKDQSEREKKLINDLINDLEKMSNDFDEQYKDLHTRSENLEKSLEIIKNF
jgi:esterase/lipase